MSSEPDFISLIKRCVACLWIIAGILLVLGVIYFVGPNIQDASADSAVASLVKDEPEKTFTAWHAPDSTLIPSNEEGELIRYGKELISHTAYYLGPNGTVMQTSNGMNCQNCHLEAGTRIKGNNYSAVASTYPKMRARSGTVEGFEKRVNDCIERSLNGKGLDSASREMRAIITYFKWLGKDVPKGVKPEEAGLVDVAKLDRAADPLKGKLVYEKQCVRCHGVEGGGIKHANGREWQYPPLWGKDSYNVGAGLFRLSRFAGYVKTNMPFDQASLDKPILTDEEAWDVAAYVNSMPRPTKDLSGDWPDISKKPFDHPFGPYADSFSEEQHKYGPYKPIVDKTLARK